MKTSKTQLALSSAVLLGLALVCPLHGSDQPSWFIDHVFKGTGAQKVLAGGGASGQFQAGKLLIPGLPEPNEYSFYYNDPSDFEVTLTDSPNASPGGTPALLVSRRRGNAQTFGGVTVSSTVPEWKAGEVTVENLDRLVMSVELAATTGIQTPIYIEALDNQNKFLTRVVPAITIQNDGEYHEYSYRFGSLSQGEKLKLTDALNKALSTCVSINFIFRFNDATNEPPPFMALRQVHLGVQ